MYVEMVSLLGRSDALRVWLRDCGGLVVSSGTVLEASYLCTIGDLRRWTPADTARIVVVTRTEREDVARSVWTNASVDAVVVEEYAWMFVSPSAGSRIESVSGGLVQVRECSWMILHDERGVSVRCDTWDEVCVALVELV